MARDRQGISPSDLNDTKEIFQGRGLPISERYFRYRPTVDRWFCYHFDGTSMTIIARCQCGHNEGWIEV